MDVTQGIACDYRSVPGESATLQGGGASDEDGESFPGFQIPHPSAWSQRAETARRPSAAHRRALEAARELPAGALPGAAEEVPAECRGLALALSVVGAMLRGADERGMADLSAEVSGAAVSAAGRACRFRLG